MRLYEVPSEVREAIRMKESLVSFMAEASMFSKEACQMLLDDCQMFPSRIGTEPEAIEFLKAVVVYLRKCMED